MEKGGNTDLTSEELFQFRAMLEEQNRPRKIILGITGASMPQLGIRTLDVLSKQPNIETHLVISEGAKEIMKHELGYDSDRIRSLSNLAHVTYDNNDLAGAISSGSFKTGGMIVTPCSMKTLADIALSRDESLIARAAIVCLKEERKMVLVPRETPATLSYLRNLVTAKENGASIVFPVPAAYHKPKTIEDIVDHIVQKVLDQFDIDANLIERWGDN